MEPFTITHYDKVKFAYFKVGRYDNLLHCSIDDAWRGMARTKGKFAAFCDGVSAVSTLEYMLKKYRGRCRACNITNIYMSSKCLTPRDLVRKSYKIVRDKEKADAVYVPNRLSDCCSETVAGIVVETDPINGKKTLYLIDFVSYPDATKATFVPVTTSDILNKIAQEDAINAADLSVVWLPDLSNVKRANEIAFKNIYFIPDVPEYEEMLTATSDLPVPYVSEYALDYEPVSRITPESLYIWKRIEDKSLFERTIAGSNWKEYPITIAVLLAIRYPMYSRNYSDMQGPIKPVVRTLWVDDLVERVEGTVRANIEVSEKDMNMLQDWIFKELGLEGKTNGLIDIAQYKKLPDIMRQFVRRKLAVSKISVKQSAVLETLKQKC